MNLITRLVHACLGGCPHPDLYRERRELHGAQILHFVCDDCGYAQPAIDRSPDEHRRIVEAGAMRPAVVMKHHPGLVAIDSRRDMLKRARRARQTKAS